MKTALILVDMQNAFCSRDGSFLKRGNSILNLNNVLKTTKLLLDFARKKKWLIIFTKLAYKSDYSDAGLLLKRNPLIRKVRSYIENTEDSEIIDFLKPQNYEVIITKKRYDPFYNTNLGKILEKNKIKKLIVTGLLTNVCVESLVRSAFDRDFEVIVVKDGTSTYSKEIYDNSLKTIKKHFAKIMNFKKLGFQA